MKRGLLSIALALIPLQAFAGPNDFDWEIGTWKTHLRRLVKPLTGSKTWIEMNGTSVVRKVLNGRANLVEPS